MWCLNIANLGLQEATQREMCWSVDTLPEGALICILIGSYPTFPEALGLTRYKIEVHTSEKHILFFASFIFIYFFILFGKIFHKCTHHYVPLRAFLLRAWNVLLSVIDIFSPPLQNILWNHARTPECLGLAGKMATASASETPCRFPAIWATAWRGRPSWSALGEGGGCGAPPCPDASVGWGSDWNHHQLVWTAVDAKV